MRVPLLDLKIQYRSTKRQIDKAIHKILDDQLFVMGKEVTMLEKNVASYCHTKYGIGLNSGTDALILGLKAFGIGKGDEVITTPFTFVATAEAIALTGAKPVFVDIDPDTYNIDPELIEEKITGRTRAILPVHLYGLCADMDPILRIARKHNLWVLEDSAQAIGSTYKGRMSGSMGDAGAISFFPSKNLGGYGDGGMIVTDNAKVDKMCRLLHNHGSDKRYHHKIIGYNSRLDNIQAAVMDIKLKYLEREISERIRNAGFFNKALEIYPLVTPKVPRDLRHTYHLYIVRTAYAERLSAYLLKEGVDSRIYYPIPLHLQKCFSYLGCKKGDFPESEKASKEVVNLPIYPGLGRDKKDYIVDRIGDFFRKKNA